MKDTILTWCDRIIRYGFYALFFLIPLALTNSTSELYELNKMWLTWEITLFIAVAWFSKMLIERSFSIKRTPLDIPLILFLVSQIISTIVSMDPHTSFWGYYSRFNGGLLSTITYIFLYYALVSNLTKETVWKILKFSLLSGFFVALWGIPSHFGKDPTCLIFRGSLDVECWTDAFKPTIRIFSTLGQPAWMSAYVNILLPIALAFALLHGKFKTSFNASTNQAKEITSKRFKAFQHSHLGLSVYVILASLFFLCLIYTNTRAGVIGFWIANLFFWLFVGIKRYLSFKTFISLLVLSNSIFLFMHFFLGTSFPQLDRFTYQSIMSGSLSHVEESVAIPTASAKPVQAAGAFGGTDSGKIRQIVWQGAIDIWKAHPVFGSGTETFAFAYYQFRPADHNLTSEWDYLYNKAHNEYLNYLATTGIVGLGTYLIFIIMFFFVTIRYLFTEKERSKESLLIVALAAAVVSILITNFFAFSVVITNLYLFLIPAFVFLLAPTLLTDRWISLPKNSNQKHTKEVSGLQWTGITIVAIAGMFFLLILIRFWYADKAYALGSNYNNVQEYQQAYLNLGEAIQLRPSEPTFKDEFAVNNATIATLLLLQDAPATPSAEAVEQARLLTNQAITLSTEVVTNHPNNITFWKDRVRLFYTLSQVDKRYLPSALDAVEHVRILAPTDAKVLYNLGALYQEMGNAAESAKVLEQTILLKPDYRDAYYALALSDNAQAVDAQGTVIRPEMREKAIRQLRFILDRLSSDDKQAIDTLASWEN